MASKIDPFAKFLGLIPDEKVAEMAGVKPSTVEKYRDKAGIAPYDPEAAQGDENAPSDAPQSAPAAPKVEAVPAPEVDYFAIQVLSSVRRGSRVIPRSIFRGAVARKIAEQLEPSDYVVLNGLD